MTPPNDAVKDAADLIRKRIRELDTERSQLERALSSLTSGREGRRGPGRPRGGRKRAGRRSTRRRRSTRADQTVRLVSANPGITASEIAKKMQIKPNYLYRVLADLEKQGRVKKDGRKYTAA